MRWVFLSLALLIAAPVVAGEMIPAGVFQSHMGGGAWFKFFYRKGVMISRSNFSFKTEDECNRFSMPRESGVTVKCAQWGK